MGQLTEVYFKATQDNVAKPNYIIKCSKATTQAATSILHRSRYGLNCNTSGPT